MRATARKTIRDRKTVARYRRKWIDGLLQKAYDLMCEGEFDAVDTITAKLPVQKLAADYAARLRDRRQLESPRLNAAGNVLEFMACVDGYVMAARPNDYPIVLTEDAWRRLEFYEGP